MPERFNSFLSLIFIVSMILPVSLRFRLTGMAISSICYFAGAVWTLVPLIGLPATVLASIVTSVLAKMVHGYMVSSPTNPWNKILLTIIGTLVLGMFLVLSIPLHDPVVRSFGEMGLFVVAAAMMGVFMSVRQDGALDEDRVDGKS